MDTIHKGDKMSKVITVLRLTLSNLDMDCVKANVLPLDATPTMAPMAKADHFVMSDDGELFTVVFRSKRIDKEVYKEKAAALKQAYAAEGRKIKKAALKDMVLAEMLPVAPVTASKASVKVIGGYVYIFGKHKKVTEALFTSSFNRTEAYDSLNPVWNNAGSPCENVTIFHPDFEWTRIFKAHDNAHVAGEAVEQGGHVTKFKDVISFALLEGRLMVSGEFTEAEEMDKVLDEAEDALNG
jgi:hypothetical protein